ncbi:hypothetical protein PSEUBRA_006226 [Kalmanozyma brasiliensis GHG001]|uniref:uncharacterized protein n=1 Tax=Kalmanozyma brasiliensis (strain GHG001) TaxID=1365824 RepID=UPI002867BAC4|nr:uncharacterized protein PSEUBRA_006226 [Kalmanozyma brasiliensis GHG001]KAF6767644.1 hypothetical protein PSEUBRA_006226 [Kalmanozyma brasiliensis GHG001]
MQHNPLNMKESQLADDHRLAICIDQIPRVKQHQEIFLEVNEEQSRDDIDICRYSTEDGTSFYSMAMALTKPGVIDAMQRTALRFPACPMRIVSFQALRKAKRDKTYWQCTEAVKDKPSRIKQVQQDLGRGIHRSGDSVTLPDSDERDNSSHQNSSRESTRDVILLEGNEDDDDDEEDEDEFDEYEQHMEEEYCCDHGHKALPFELVTRVFLDKERKASSDDEALIGSCARRMRDQQAGPLTRAEAEAQTAAYQAQRLEAAARRAIHHKQELEQDWRKKEEQGDFDLSSEDRRRDRLYAFEDICEAIDLAWHRILDADLAREEAKLLDEIARFQDESVHKHQPEPAIRYTVIFCKDGIDTASVPSSPLDIIPAPGTFTQGTRRWNFAVALRLPDQASCTEHLTRQLTEAGISEGKFSISFILSKTRKSFTYVQIAFEHPVDFAQAESLGLVWEDRPLKLCSSVQPLDAPMTLLGVENFLIKRDSNRYIRRQPAAFSDITLESYIKRLESQTLEAHIIWRLDQDHQIRGETITLEGTSIVALVSYKQKPVSSSSTPPSSNVYYEPKDVPGFVYTMQGYKPIKLLGRAPACTKCNGHCTWQYHLEEECEYGSCEGCGTEYDSEDEYWDHLNFSTCPP